MNYKIALLSAVAFSCALPIFAQTSDIQETIHVTSTRALTIEEVTSSFSIIGEDALNVRNSIFVADQLRAVPGLGVSRSGGQGSLTQIRIRGSEGNHTLVLFDGIEVSNPISGETDFGLWSGSNIDRIEVARGEQSALYGSDAIGGVIALSTEKDANKGKGQIETGSFGTHRGKANATFASDIGHLGFSISGSKSDGVDISGTGGQKDGYQNQAFSTYGTLAKSKDWELSGLASFSRSDIDFDADTDFDGLLNDIDKTSKTDQYIAGLSLTAQSGSINHLIRASYNQVTINSETDGSFDNETDGKRAKFAYLPTFEKGSDTKSLALTGILDLETTDYERVDTNTFFGDPNQSQTFKTLGLGTELRLRLNDFIINGSVRNDNNEDHFDDSTTWRIGTAYNLPINSKIRASIGTGVKNPTFTELFGFTPANFVGNPDLVPEKSQSWEIGYDQTLGPVTTSLTYFEAELEDEIYTSFVFDPVTYNYSSTSLNRTGLSDRSGIEFDIQWAINKAFNISGAFSDISSNDDNKLKEIRVPEQTGNIAFRWHSQQYDGLTLGVALDYVGEQNDKNFGPFPAQTVQLSAYSLLSANLDIPFSERIALTLRGENLLDEETTDVFGYHAQGRGLFIGLRLR